jgi:hypothetical protein
MNEASSNAGGYAASEIRTYVNVNFLAGLKALGVPTDGDTYIWSPTRPVSNGNSGYATTTNITDKLWLPTEREMFNAAKYSNASETAANQAYLEYYTDDTKRIKYKKTSAGSATTHYWQASPDNNVDTNKFAAVKSDGTFYYYGSGTSQGVSPAFCVK